VRWPSSSSPSSGGRRGAVPAGLEASSRAAAEAPDVRLRSDGRGSVCVRVCVRVAWGRPIRGAWRGGEAKRSALVTALGSLLVTSMLGHGGALRAESDGSNRGGGKWTISEERLGISLDLPLFTLGWRAACVSICCRENVLCLGPVSFDRRAFKARCVAGFRCRAGRAADVAPRSRCARSATACYAAV
jgi:hypothetical protein